MLKLLQKLMYQVTLAQIGLVSVDKIYTCSAQQAVVFDFLLSLFAAYLAFDVLLHVLSFHSKALFRPAFVVQC